MNVEQAYNFRKIDALTSTAGVLSKQQLAALGPEGYRAVINLLPGDSEYAIADEAAIVQAQGIDYAAIPVDFAAPTNSDYAAFAASMDAATGTKVMIHCAANYRASAFYAIYAVNNLGWSAEQAMAFIGSVWNPQEHPPWADFVAEGIGAATD